MKSLLRILILVTLFSELGCMTPLATTKAESRMAATPFPEDLDKSVFSPNRTSIVQPTRPVSLAPCLKVGELSELVRFQSPEKGPEPTLQYYFDSDVNSEWNTGSSRWLDGLRMGDFMANVNEDHKLFYSRENSPMFAGALGLAALMANTDLDQNILEHVQDEFTFARNDEYREFVEEYRFFGEGYFLVPVYIGSAIIGKRILPAGPLAKKIGEWGDRSCRAVLLGVPPLLISQYLLGASRPGESAEGSKWQFAGDSNALSGHSFMGAIPFLTAAHLTDDPLRKGTLYLFSALPALSRITENGHYPSQAILGWTLAYVATRSVAKSGTSNLSVYPTVSGSDVGIGFSLKR